jgi:prepilin-type processing-associated H-X9-DG protein
LQYQQDYDDRLPQAALARKGSPDRLSSDSYGWAEAVQPYLKKSEFLQCPSEKNAAQNDSMKPGYTDYWLNTLLAGALADEISKPSIMILSGDGDGGAPNSNARYHLRSMPQSWVSTPKSPATRHKGVGCYAFADGHVSLLAIADIGVKDETLQDLSRERLSKRID